MTTEFHPTPTTDSLMKHASYEKKYLIFGIIFFIITLFFSTPFIISAVKGTLSLPIIIVTTFLVLFLMVFITRTLTKLFKISPSWGEAVFVNGTIFLLGVPIMFLSRDIANGASALIFLLFFVTGIIELILQIIIMKTIYSISAGKAILLFIGFFTLLYVLGAVLGIVFGILLAALFHL